MSEVKEQWKRKSERNKKAKEAKEQAKWKTREIKEWSNVYPTMVELSVIELKPRYSIISLFSILSQRIWNLNVVKPRAFSFTINKPIWIVVINCFKLLHSFQPEKNNNKQPHHFEKMKCCIVCFVSHINFYFQSEKTSDQKMHLKISLKCSMRRKLR